MKSVDELMKNVFKNVEFNDFSDTKKEDGECKNCEMDLNCDVCHGCTECETGMQYYIVDDYGLMVDKDIFDLVIYEKNPNNIINDEVRMIEFWDSTKEYLNFYYTNWDGRICDECTDKVRDEIEKEYGKNNEIKVELMRDYLENVSDDLGMRIDDYIVDSDIKIGENENVSNSKIKKEIQKNFLELKKVFDNEPEKVVACLNRFEKEKKNNERER